MTRILPVAVLLWLGAAPALTRNVTAWPARAGQAPAPADWREAPAYLTLFAPSGSRAAAYHIYVSLHDIQTVLTEIERDAATLHPPGAWSPAALLPSDAFGQTGRYDRSKLARLYGAKRAMVARGPRGQAGQPAEAWTLISPYPSGDMQRLEPGTMLIVLDLGQLGAP